MFKEALLKNAATAMAHWLQDKQVNVATLDQRLRANEPILDEALASIPKEQLGGIRLMARPFLKGLTEADYAKVLTYLWEFPAAREHALLLHQKYFHSHWIPAMQRVQQWLLTGTP